jgi:hypothetical protein
MVDNLKAKMENFKSSHAEIFGQSQEMDKKRQNTQEEANAITK